MSTRLVGERVARVEDPRMLTGGGRYLDDLSHDALTAAFVRSPHAHARITDIDVTGALEIEGVVAVYTWDDLDDADRAEGSQAAAPLPVLIPHPALTHARTPRALARDVVHHVGEAVVMVVARDRYVAEDACGRIVVSYDPLPAVVGVAQARAGEVLVHPDVPGNIAAHLVQGDDGVEAALAAAPHLIELDLEIERSASMPMEGKGVYARWDVRDDSLRMYSSTQTSTSVRLAVAARLGLPPSKVECIAPDVGGGFGVKIVHPWPEEVLVPWAARRLARAGVAAEVIWTEDRREHFVSSAHERAQLQHIRVGVDDE